MTTKEQYWANPEKYRKQRRNWVSKNREKVNEWDRQFYRNNREKILKRKRTYYKKHAEEINAKQRERTRKNKQKAVARHLVNNNKIPFDNCCSKCGSTVNLERHHPDYSKPLEVVTLCKSCHYRLHAKQRRVKKLCS